MTIMIIWNPFQEKRAVGFLSPDTSAPLPSGAGAIEWQQMGSLRSIAAGSTVTLRRDQQTDSTGAVATFYKDAELLSRFTMSPAFAFDNNNGTFIRGKQYKLTGFMLRNPGGWTIKKDEYRVELALTFELAAKSDLSTNKYIIVSVLLNADRSRIDTCDRQTSWQCITYKAYDALFPETGRLSSQVNMIDLLPNQGRCNSFIVMTRRRVDTIYMIYDQEVTVPERILNQWKADSSGFTDGNVIKYVAELDRDFRVYWSDWTTLVGSTASTAIERFGGEPTAWRRPSEAEGSGQGAGALVGAKVGMMALGAATMLAYSVAGDPSQLSKITSYVMGSGLGITTLFASSPFDFIVPIGFLMHLCIMIVKYHKIGGDKIWIVAAASALVYIAFAIGLGVPFYASSQYRVMNTVFAGLLFVGLIGYVPIGTKTIFERFYPYILFYTKFGITNPITIRFYSELTPNLQIIDYINNIIDRLSDGNISKLKYEIMDHIELFDDIVDQIQNDWHNPTQQYCNLLKEMFVTRLNYIIPPYLNFTNNNINKLMYIFHIYDNIGQLGDVYHQYSINTQQLNIYVTNLRADRQIHADLQITIDDIVNSPSITLPHIVSRLHPISPISVYRLVYNIIFNNINIPFDIDNIYNNLRNNIIQIQSIDQICKFIDSLSFDNSYYHMYNVLWDIYKNICKSMSIPSFNGVIQQDKKYITYNNVQDLYGMENYVNRTVEASNNFPVGIIKSVDTHNNTIELYEEAIRDVDKFYIHIDPISYIFENKLIGDIINNISYDDFYNIMKESIRRVFIHRKIDTDILSQPDHQDMMLVYSYIWKNYIRDHSNLDNPIYKGIIDRIQSLRC